MVLLSYGIYKLVIRLSSTLSSYSELNNLSSTMSSSGELNSELIQKNSPAMQKRELTIFELNYKLDKATTDIEHFELTLHELNNELKQAAGPKSKEALQKKIYTAECKLDKAYHDRELARLKLYNLGAQD